MYERLRVASVFSFMYVPLVMRVQVLGKKRKKKGKEKAYLGYGLIKATVN